MDLPPVVENFAFAFYSNQHIFRATLDQVQIYQMVGGGQVSATGISYDVEGKDYPFDDKEFVGMVDMSAVTTGSVIEAASEPPQGVRRSQRRPLVYDNESSQGVDQTFLEEQEAFNRRMWHVRQAQLIAERALYESYRIEQTLDQSYVVEFGGRRSFYSTREAAEQAVQEQWVLRATDRLWDRLSNGDD